MGPDGTVIDLSGGNDDEAIQGTGYFGIRSSRESRTSVLLGKPKGGTWEVQPVEGSPAITGRETSPILPNPVSKATAGGVGASRILRYRIARVAGQVVRFTEVANGGARLIGTMHGAIAKHLLVRGG